MNGRTDGQMYVQVKEETNTSMKLFFTFMGLAEFDPRCLDGWMEG